MWWSLVASQARDPSLSTNNRHVILTNTNDFTANGPYRK